MARAILNGEVVAQSDIFEVVEGNVYFPAEAVATGDPGPERSAVPLSRGRGSPPTTTLRWAVRPSLMRPGTTLSRSRAAANIRGHVAFYAPPVVVER